MWYAYAGFEERRLIARVLRAEDGVMQDLFDSAIKMEVMGRPVPMGACLEKDAGDGGMGVFF
jgi:hypothetical protein